MQTELITDLGSIEADVLAGWDGLAIACALPFATPSWMLAFWREMHEPSGDAELRVVLVRDGAELVGLGPFYAGKRRRFGLREWWPLGAGIGQRTGPLARPGREREVAAALAGALAAERPTIVRLPASDAAVPWGSWLAAAWPHIPRPHDLVQSIVPAPSLAVREDGDYEAWIGARSRNFRSEISRRTRNAARRGGELRRVADPEEVPAALTMLFALQRERFATLGRTSLVTAQTERAVAAGTADLLRAGTGARVWVVDTPKGIVGAQVHLVAGPRMCFYSGGSSPDLAKESLGTVLLAAAVRDAHELGLRTLDLGAGDQGYKRRFADGDAPLVWRSVIPRGMHYPLERGRLIPADARRIAKRAIARLPDRHRNRLMALRRAGAGSR